MPGGAEMRSRVDWAVRVFTKAGWWVSNARRNYFWVCSASSATLVKPPPAMVAITCITWP